MFIGLIVFSATLIADLMEYDVESDSKKQLVLLATALGIGVYCLANYTNAFAIITILAFLIGKGVAYGITEKVVPVLKGRQEI